MNTFGSASGNGSGLPVERTCTLIAAALSGRRLDGVRLVSGDKAAFGLSSNGRLVHVPFPPPDQMWTLRTLACGIALQCAPSKQLVAQLDLSRLTNRELRALVVIEGALALGWIHRTWPGLRPELDVRLAGLVPIDDELDGRQMLDRALALADSSDHLPDYPVLGRLTSRVGRPHGITETARRMWGRMPWTSRRQDAYRIYSVPVGGDGGVRNPNLPPPSRPEDEELEFSPHQRPGVPYPEWNGWTQRFLKDHVAVVETRHQHEPQHGLTPRTDLRRHFARRTTRLMRNGLEDGSDIDIDRYVDHFVDRRCGHTSEGRVFRDLVPSHRDVSTCLLLDGSSSLGTQQGRIFQLELECADALSHAMTAARERHAVFSFTGNTRHHVEVRCLKDFGDRYFVAPSALGLQTAGYTRLGAPLRHLTSRLLTQPSERRLVIAIGDGLMSDEGYEGRYAWADVAHAVEEAEEAGVFIYYIGVGPTRVDPLPEVFGPRRSTRIARVEDLPRVLGRVHRELVCA